MEWYDIVMQMEKMSRKDRKHHDKERRGGGNNLPNPKMLWDQNADHK